MCCVFNAVEWWAPYSFCMFLWVGLGSHSPPVDCFGAGLDLMECWRHTHTTRLRDPGDWAKRCSCRAFLFHPLFGIRLDSNMFQFANYTNVSRPNVDDFSIYPMIFTMSYHNFPSCTIIIINYPMILPSVSSSAAASGSWLPRDPRVHWEAGEACSTSGWSVFGASLCGPVTISWVN